MATPVETQILDFVAERLALISSANGYFTDVELIERARLTPLQNSDMPAINYYSTKSTLVKKLTNGVREKQLTVMVEYYTFNRDEIFTDVANKLAADVLIALERDTSAPSVSDTVSYALGGKVSAVDMEEYTPVLGSGTTPYSGAIILINIIYRVNRYNPFDLIT